MQVRMLKNTHVTGVDASIEVQKDGTIKRVLTVDTDLELNPSQPGYDAQAVHDLVKEVTEKLGDLYDRADIRGITGRPVSTRA